MVYYTRCWVSVEAVYWDGSASATFDAVALDPRRIRQIDRGWGLEISGLDLKPYDYIVKVGGRIVLLERDVFRALFATAEELDPWSELNFQRMLENIDKREGSSEVGHESG